jgi:dolichol-phosphate mannosyltransferase
MTRVNGAAIRGKSSEKPSLSVVLPTYNERDNIEALIRRILGAVEEPTEVIVVDDDSPDGTWRVVGSMAGASDRIRLIHRTRERGLTSAIARGVEESRGDAVAWMDCDFSHPPELLPSLAAALEDADFAVASRYVPGGEDLRDSFLARLLSRAINGFSSLVLDRSIRDYTSGYIAARREAVQSLSLRGDYGEYCIDLLCRAKRRGMTVREIPYKSPSRTHGESKTATNLKGFLRRGIKYVAVVLRLRFFPDEVMER